MIQLQGYANEALASLSFDVSNATGIRTNQTGYTTGQFTDTNLLKITTNYFQCYDIALTTNGVNLITLHATDLANNTATTNLSVTLNYSGATNPPALTVIWPQTGTEISGSQFTFQGQVDDPTATITASIVDTNGDTNTVQGLVERSGSVWVQNLPLGGGENTLTITVTDAVGNTSVTNLTLYQSSVTVTMNPLGSNQFNQSSVSVTGTVSDSTYTVTVNGVTATVNTNGTWAANNVTVNSVGTAVFDVEVTGPSDPAQVFTQAPPVNVVLMSYSSESAGYEANNGQTGLIGWYPTDPDLVFGQGYFMAWRNVDWAYQSGGLDAGYAYYSGWFNLGDGSGYELAEPTHDLWKTTLPGGPNGFNPTWEYNPADGINTRVMILPSGPAVPGATVTYLVQAQVTNENDGGQEPPASTQIQGVTLTPGTNTDGSVWGNMLLQAPAGATPEVTPTSPGSNTFIVAVTPLHIYFGGQDITGNNATVFVGQQISLTCGFGSNGPQITNYQWTVPGNTISNFYISPDALQTNGYPIPLTDTNNSEVNFYWVDGGTNQVQCTVKVAGMTTLNTTTFIVKKPTAELSATIEGTVDIQNNNTLIFGYGLPGIAFFENNESIDGNWALVQLGSQSYSWQEAATGQWYIGQGSGLDGADPYPQVAETDNPSTGLNPDMSQATGNGSFTMYLTFMPNETNAIRVPIRQIHWSWSGTATNSGGVWTASGTATNDASDSPAPPTISWTNSISNTINNVQLQ